MICNICTIEDSIDNNLCFQCISMVQIENTVKVLERTKEVLDDIENMYGYEAYAFYMEMLDSMLENIEVRFPRD